MIYSLEFLYVIRHMLKSVVRDVEKFQLRQVENTGGKENISSIRQQNETMSGLNLNNYRFEMLILQSLYII